ncbi:MAG TPA: RsmG family class I SAM-dependent methyltransferase [Ilumatobacter sp.]|nr:RsmG family class I SAM-dependent methyltransferase [Ilumatobacter sp.]
MQQHPELLETLRQAQRFGFFGSRPIDEAVEHSRSFVDALSSASPPNRLVDLGSGGGLPGLVLADVFRTTTIVLTDRREKRTDFLSRAVSRLAYSHVSVVPGDVESLCRSVEARTSLAFDVVTARGFGPPEVTLRFARRLMTVDGSIVISEPPNGDRWDPALLNELGLAGEPRGRVRVFRASSHLPN